MSDTCFRIGYKCNNCGAEFWKEFSKGEHIGTIMPDCEVCEIQGYLTINKREPLDKQYISLSSMDEQELLEKNNDSTSYL